MVLRCLIPLRGIGFACASLRSLGEAESRNKENYWFSLVTLGEAESRNVRSATVISPRRAPALYALFNLHGLGDLTLSAAFTATVTTG